MKLLTFLLLLSSGLMAQFPEGFKKLDAHNYSYQDKKGKLHEFKDEFKTNPELYKDFKKFNASRQAQKSLNYVGLSLGGVSLIGGIILNKSFEGSEVDGLGLGLGLAGVVIAGAFTGVCNIFAGVPKIRYKERLLKKINLPTTSLHEKEKSLEFKNTANGIGLVYTF